MSTHSPALSTVRLGLIGAGRIGRLHARHLAFHIPTAELVAVADVRPEAAEACARACHVPHAVADYREVIARPDVDAVVICSATHTHVEIIEAAAAAGKHIFCEKPLALHLEEVYRALRAVRAAGVKLQVGFNRRFDANYRRVREAIARGEIGTPHLLHIISRDPEPPPPEYVRSSGGLFLDMTIHDFDMARYLIGGEVVELYAVAGVRVDPAIGELGDVDTAVVLLSFENGVFGTIDNSRRAVYGYDQRVEVFGSDGCIRTENEHPNTAVISTARAVCRDLPLHFFVNRYTASYLAEMEAFVEAVREDRPVPVTGEDGLMALVMGLAACRSLEEKRPVRLAEIVGG